jgi:PAS domain S-box-containing protein
MKEKIKRKKKVNGELTKLQRRVSELEKERGKFLQIVENTKAAIFVTSADCTIVYTNPAMDELFGYERGELIGEKPSVFNASPDPVKFMNNIMKTLKKKGYWEGAVHNKKKDGTEFVTYARKCVLKNSKGEITNFLITESDITEHNHVKNQLNESRNKFQEILEETIHAMALTIEKRDLFTAGHQRRVAELAVAIAKAMKLPKKQITAVYMAGLLHDIGKINIPAEILTKPSRLNELEFKLIKKHPRVAHDILKEIEFPWPLAKISLQHHERMNGSGYPNGVKGRDIILEARIIAVADVVEAMSSARPYRPALGIEEALKEISTKKSLLYDADVVDACIKLFKKKGFKFK